MAPPVVDRAMADRDAASLARAYYRTIDAGDYDGLADLLAGDFVQVRGDRTLEGRETFVRFMREERPETDTTHEVDAVYLADAPAGGSGPSDRGSGGTTGVAVRGRLRRADGSVWFGFVDAFDVVHGRLSRLVTYANARVD